jgi:hypothetical protein
MNNAIILPIVLVFAGVLAGCTNTNNDVRISAEKPAEPAKPVAKARNEPIFYNGKTYQLKFQPVAGGIFKMSVAGMSDKQQKDAVAVATSSLRYFACPDGKTGKLTEQPTYADAVWSMSAHCA